MVAVTRKKAGSSGRKQDMLRSTKSASSSSCGSSYHIKTRSTFSGTIRWSKLMGAKNVKTLSSQVVVDKESTNIRNKKTVSSKIATATTRKIVEMDKKKDTRTRPFIQTGNIISSNSPSSQLTLRNRTLSKLANQRQQHVESQKKSTLSRTSPIVGQENVVRWELRSRKSLKTSQRHQHVQSKEKQPPRSSRIARKNISAIRPSLRKRKPVNGQQQRAKSYKTNSKKREIARKETGFHLRLRERESSKRSRTNHQCWRYCCSQEHVNKRDEPKLKTVIKTHYQTKNTKSGATSTVKGTGRGRGRPRKCEARPVELKKKVTYQQSKHSIQHPTTPGPTYINIELELKVGKYFEKKLAKLQENIAISKDPEEAAKLRKLQKKLELKIVEKELKKQKVRAEKKAARKKQCSSIGNSRRSKFVHINISDSEEKDTSSQNLMLPNPHHRVPIKLESSSISVEEFNLALSEAESTSKESTFQSQSNNNLTTQTKPKISDLIYHALKYNPRGMDVCQIYNWVPAHFPHYRPKTDGWKKSIRHNLSVNRMFKKCEKSINGSGRIWRLADPNENNAAIMLEHEESMLEADTLLLRDPTLTESAGLRMNRVLQPSSSNFDFYELESNEGIQLSEVVKEEGPYTTTTITEIPLDVAIGFIDSDEENEFGLNYENSISYDEQDLKFLENNTREEFHELRVHHSLMNTIEFNSCESEREDIMAENVRTMSDAPAKDWSISI